METKFLTIKEVAQMLRVSELWVRRRMNNGEIPSYKLGRRRLFKAEEVEGWIESQKKDEPRVVAK